ncbi:MAG: hypothetical protein NUV46_01910 [Nanoarchaeota archaeon]|nr:hypothetical protein [Nanoarchaeota archaeon]
MIKKNTKAIFIDSGKEREEDLIGGIPLCVGENMTIIGSNSKKINWKVVDKKVEYINGGENQTVNITYTFEKQ